jgi:UDP:flavonoid glycosyltransferase YjiC (YdhE family)
MSQSYRIVFYVSGHGFGHSSRTIEVIRAVLRRGPDLPIVVKTSASRRLFDRTLETPVDFVELECDAGMVQVDSLRVDIRESLQRAKAFQSDLPAKAAKEAAFLGRINAGLVVGDIPPLASAAASMAGLPSMAIGNFTWDWIYEGYPEEEPFELASMIRRDYRKAATVLRLPTSGGFQGLEDITRDIPFIARRSSRDAADTRRAFGLPAPGEKPVVLMSFGGYGVTGLDRTAVGAAKDYVVMTTDVHADTRPATDGLIHVHEQDLYGRGYRYEDLVRAADVVVTKPGYGIVSEAMANDTAILYTSRGRFVEYDVLVREMPRFVRSAFIDPQDLLCGNWAAALERLLSQPAPPERPATNGADVAAEEILKMIRSG